MVLHSFVLLDYNINIGKMYLVAKNEIASTTLTVHLYFTFVIYKCKL